MSSREIPIGSPIVDSNDFRVGMVVSTGRGSTGRTFKIVKAYIDGGWGWVELRKNGTWPKTPKRINETWLRIQFPSHGYDVIADPTTAAPTLAQPPGTKRAAERASKRSAGHERAKKQIGGRTRPGGTPWRGSTLAERVAMRAGVDFQLWTDGRGGFARLSARDFAKIVEALGGE